MTAVLEIRLLGGLEIRREGASISGFVSSKAPALLAYLVVTDCPHQRDALSALLWGEMDDADAKNNLRQTLSNLRKLLEPYLHINRDIVAWNTAASCTLDVAQFTACLQAGRDVPPAARATAFQQAAALYRGDFLAGFVVRDAPDFEDWLLAQRARYRELALHALHSLTEYHLERGEYGRAIDYATRLLGLDAWREEAHRQLMRALIRSGQRAAALAQYENCRRILDRELGVSPSAETTALYERISAAGETPPHHLPAQPTPFIGREEELAQIAGCLQNPECRLLTLVGAGGMGKTRLALQAAERAHRQGLFLHGVFYVPLVGVDSLTRLVTAVATACDLQFSGSQSPDAQLLAFLRDREILLVLDNFEHLLDESVWLVELLRQSPGVRLLITSREPLDVQWERSLYLDGLTTPPHTVNSADAATAYSAVQLFLIHAQKARPDFTLSAEEIPHLVQICHLVAGMPLAIELAAATTRYYTCAELLEAIQNNLDVLRSGFRDVAPRHRSLQAVFDNAWALLPASEQQIFAALSVFVGSFSHQAAEVVTGASREGLAALVHKSLLRQVGNGRYQLHNVLRQYAAQRLTEPQQQTLRQQHANFYANWLHKQEQMAYTPAEAEIFAALQSDLENVRAAWFFALNQQQLPLLVKSLKGLRSFYNVRSRFQEGAEWLEQSTSALEPLASPENPEALTLYQKLLARLASFAAWQGQNDQAETLFQKALPLARQINDPEELGFLLLNKGYLSIIAGDYELAGQEYQESLIHYRRIEDRRGIADALSALGGWHNITGDWDEARRCLEESVTLARQIQDEHGLRSSLTNLGNVYYHLGDYAQAKTYYEEALPLCQKVGDRASEAILQCNLGSLAERAGAFATAEQRLQSGIALFQEANHLSAVVHASTMLAAIYRQMQRFADAWTVLSQALQQAIQQKYEYLLPITLFEIGMTYVSLNRSLEALPLLLWVMAHPAAQAEHRLEAKGVVEAFSPEQRSAAQLASESLQVTAVLANLQREM